jgi:hypothetical protein
MPSLKGEPERRQAFLSGVGKGKIKLQSSKPKEISKSNLQARREPCLALGGIWRTGRRKGNERFDRIYRMDIMGF